MFALFFGVLVTGALRGSGSIVGFAFVVLIAAIGLWLVERKQRDDLRPNSRLVLLLILVGAGLVTVWKVFHLDGMGLLGAIFVYLGVGLLLSRWRHSTRHSYWRVPKIWRGPVILGMCAVLFLVGAATLAPGIPVWSVLTVVVSVLAAPVGLTLLSADAIELLGSAHWKGIRLTLGALGLALFLACVGVFMFVADTPTQLTLFVAVAALVVIFAIASNTQADVLIVAIVLGLLIFATPRSQMPGEHHRPDTGEATLVALGDSYMSGEGAQVFFEGTDDKGSNECRRAPSAYAAEGVGAGAQFTQVAFIACSGAKAVEIYAESQHPGEPVREVVGEEAGLNQLDHLRWLLEGNAFSVDLVILAVGGNDSGFSKIGMTCLAPGSCDQVADLWLGNLAHVRTQVAAAYQQVRAAIGPEVPVVVVPYPMPLSPDACGRTWLTQGEHEFLAEFTTELNRTVRREADRAGFWYLAEMEASLAEAELRLCDDNPDGVAGVNFIGLRSVQGLIEDRLNPSNWVHNSLHPNEVGHDAMGRVFSAWLDVHPDLSPVPDTGVGQIAPEAVDVAAADQTEPPCALTDTSSAGCNAQARDWAVGQTTDIMWPAGLVPLGGLVGAWLLSIAVLGRPLVRRSAREVGVFAGQGSEPGKPPAGSRSQLVDSARD